MLLQANPPNVLSQLIGGHAAVETKGRGLLFGGGRKVEVRQAVLQVGALTTFLKNSRQRCPAWAVQKLDAIREVVLACHAAQQCLLVLSNKESAMPARRRWLCAYLAQNVRAVDKAKQVEIGERV